MAVDPGKVCLYIPPELKDFKLRLFERIASHIRSFGGTSTKDANDLTKLPPEILPIIGCSPYLRQMIIDWKTRSRNYIYWDRGYARRVFATWLPRGAEGGYYRWHLNSFQMQKIRSVPDDRWRELQTAVVPWVKNLEGHIVLAKPSKTYAEFHGINGWLDKTVYALSLTTKRQIVVRDKETKRDLKDDLRGALCLVTHGSNTAVEAAILGCPVFVDPCSAAALVGQTDLSRVDHPTYPDRTAWVNSLAYCQFNEKELCDGTLWKMIE